MSSKLRPGIYSTYEVYSESKNTNGKVVALCAGATLGARKSIVSYAEAVETYGSESNMAKLIKIILANGAGEVMAIPVQDGDYAAAFALAVAEEDAEFIVCDSESTEVHAALKTAIMSADENKKYKLGIAQMQGGAEALSAAAQSLNCERIVLCGNYEPEGTAGSVAAALSGLLSAQKDPALPLNGAVLREISALENKFSDSQTEELLRAGVTPVELECGEAIIVRGVTTRTETDGEADASFRDISTVLVIDDVLPAVRDALKRCFVRAKNTPQTRGAIRTQTVIVLEEKLRQEVIASYDNVTVQADAEDPTVCRVSFNFSVMSGLNIIELLACLTV